MSCSRIGIDHPNFRRIVVIGLRLFGEFYLAAPFDILQPYRDRTAWQRCGNIDLLTVDGPASDSGVEHLPAS